MISILLSPDRSEIVAPIPDRELNVFESFIGVETGKQYEAAFLRTDQDPEITEQKLTVLSDIRQTMQLFSPTDTGTADVISMIVRAMLTVAERLAESGYSEGDVISVGDVNATRKE